MKINIEILNYRVNDVASSLGISVATVWRWSKQSQLTIDNAMNNNQEIPANLFPIPKKLSKKVTVWNVKEIQEWNDKQQVA